MHEGHEVDFNDNPALADLRRQIESDLEVLSYADRDWVRGVFGPLGERAHDVVIIGAGQAGLGTAFALRREGVRNILVLDLHASGQEGIWENFARMSNLRTPKAIVGIEGGIPSLSAPSFYKARYGEDDWRRIDRIERTRWMEFLRWFRDVTGVSVSNDLACRGLEPHGDLIALTVQSTTGITAVARVVHARHVVLATGYDGCGAWSVPPGIAAAVPPDRIDHSNGPINFKRLAGRRVGILGHGASAFDNACVALEHGAARVDLCFRRAQLPTINPHRRLEFAGFLKHFYDLDDETRWRSNLFFERRDQPPTQYGYDFAHSFENFRMHAGTPWLDAFDDGRMIRVRTPARTFEFDHLICATGVVVDYEARDELRRLGPLVQRWRHVFNPRPEDSSETLGEYPYLGAGFEYLPLNTARDDWVRRVKAFNFSAILSMGPHTTSASGHQYAIPRLVAGITRALMSEQADCVLPALYAYQEAELKPRVSRAESLIQR